MTLTDDEVQVVKKAVQVALANPGRFPLPYRTRMQAVLDKLEGKSRAAAATVDAARVPAVAVAPVPAVAVTPVPAVAAPGVAVPLPGVVPVTPPEPADPPVGTPPVTSGVG